VTILKAVKRPEEHVMERPVIIQGRGIFILLSNVFENSV
jgi:hypothetical protein